MNYTIEFDNHEKYLYAHVHGKDSIANSLDYWARIRAACEHYDQHNVLVIEELSDPPDKQGTYQVATTIPEMFLNYPVRLAFVTPGREPGENENFAFDVTRKRGLQVKTFSRLDEAKHWLENAH